MAGLDETAVDFEIRPFHPVDDEYLACLAIQTCYPEDPQDTLNEWQYRDKTARKDALRARFVLTWTESSSVTELFQIPIGWTRRTESSLVTLSIPRMKDWS